MRRRAFAGAVCALLAAALPASAQPGRNPSAAVQRDWADGRWRAPLVPFRGGVPAGAPLRLPSFTPAAQARWTAITEAAAKGRILFDPAADCKPLGIPVAMIGFPFEILFSDGRVTFIYEETGVRRVFTDGRRIPPEDERDPQYVGHAVGRWSGDTLVVDGAGFIGRAALDVGMPHSDKLTTHEIWRKLGPDALEVRITFTDPEVLAEPWTVTRTYRRTRDLEIAETVCDNNRNPHSDGVTTFLGPDGKPIAAAK